MQMFTKKKYIFEGNRSADENYTLLTGIEICVVFLNGKVVFCILSRVSKRCFELIDTERDEDISMH